MDACHADVVEARDLRPHQLGGHRGLLRDRDVRGARGHDQHGATPRGGWLPDRDDVRGLVITTWGSLHPSLKRFGDRGQGGVPPNRVWIPLLWPPILPVWGRGLPGHR